MNWIHTSIDSVFVFFMLPCLRARLSQYLCFSCISIQRGEPHTYLLSDESRRHLCVFFVYLTWHSVILGSLVYKQRIHRLQHLKFSTGGAVDLRKQMERFSNIQQICFLNWSRPTIKVSLLFLLAGLLCTCRASPVWHRLKGMQCLSHSKQPTPS